MSAQTFTLTQTPVRITDGLKPVYIQEIRGSKTRYTCTTAQPDPATTAYCQILDNDISIGAGFPIWAWTPTSTSIEVTVLTAET